jgi:N-glycosidase YbiA
MMIKFYKTKEPYGFMSNYYKARFHIYGRWWNWVEAPYQSAKTSVIEEKNMIWLASKANDARLLGQKVTMVPDWDQIKRQVMQECCLAKFLQHPDLRQQLMATGEEELIEDSPTDFFWGCGEDGTGQNVLGQVLMEIRWILRGE